MSEPILRTLTVPVEYAGQRLDQVLAELLSDFSRTRIKDWIEAGQVLVDGEKLRPKDKVLGGEQVVITRHGHRVAELRPAAGAPKGAPSHYGLLKRERDARKAVDITSVELLRALYEDDE